MSATKAPDTPSLLNAETRLLVILGHPIEHVRAPVVWTGLFQRFGINAVCIPVDAAPQDFDVIVSGLKRIRNLHGIILTMPHKVAALEHVDRLLDDARYIGAINLMRREADGSWSGAMMDGKGFIRGLHAQGICLTGKRAFVLGVGGVGQAIAWALASSGIASLTVSDVNDGRAASLVAAMRGKTDIPVNSGNGNLRDYDLVVNATPIGLHVEDPLPFPLSDLSSSTVVADVIMEPFPSRLIVEAEKAGLRGHHGRHMMNQQIAASAEFFGFGDYDWTAAAEFN